MNRKPLAALIALAALPVAVIASTAIDTAVSTASPAGRLSTITHTRLTDTGGSNVFEGLGYSPNCTTINASGINPNPGATEIITIANASGTQAAAPIRTTSGDWRTTYSNLTSGTKYTITMTDGTYSDSFAVSTKSC